MLFFSRYATTPQFAQELPKVTGLLTQLQGSSNGTRHLLMLLPYLARLKDQQPYKATREVIRSILGARSAEALMKSVAEELMEKGEKRGLKKGLKQGRVEGRVAERAESILKLLAVRGIRVSSRARQRILACQELATLERWFARAVHANTVSEVFDELPQ